MSRVRSPEGVTFLLAALLLVLTGRPARAESAGSIELLAGKRRELSVDPSRAEERIKVHLPFRLSGAPAPAALTVHPVSAMRGAREALSFLERVTGEVIHDSASQGSVLLLQIDLGKPVEPGVYDLQLRLDAAGAEPWLTQVELVIPTAQIDPPPRQVIEIIRGAPAPMPALHLHEASGHSRVTLQDISQPSALHDGLAIAPMLRFSLPSAPIRAGGTLDLTPELAGELPLGTSTATVQLRAPELERPVEVAYEIRVRRSSGWICAFAALGLRARTRDEDQERSAPLSMPPWCSVGDSPGVNGVALSSEEDWCW